MRGRSPAAHWHESSPYHLVRSLTRRPSGGRTMTAVGHLWAIGYDDVGRADAVRHEIKKLGWDEHYLFLMDAAVVVRHADGSFTFNHEPFPVLYNILGCTAVGFLAGLVVAAPLGGAAIGAVVGGAGSIATSSVGIKDEFVADVEKMMKAGTSALFVLDNEGDMDVILHEIRGLGGTVLKTNVDMERARLIQSTLAAPPGQARKADRG